MKTLKNILTIAFLFIATISMAQMPDEISLGGGDSTNPFDTLAPNESVTYGDWKVTMTNGYVKIRWDINGIEIKPFFNTNPTYTLEYLGTEIGQDYIQGIDTNNTTIPNMTDWKYSFDLSNNALKFNILGSEDAIISLIWLEYLPTASIDNDNIEDDFNIELSFNNLTIENTNYESFSYGIYSMNGQMVAGGDCINTVEIDMNGKSGIYVVIIIQNGQSIREKYVISQS